MCDTLHCNVYSKQLTFAHLPHHHTTDNVVAKGEFDPALTTHSNLVREVEVAFTQALDSERGANFLVNLVLQLDSIATGIATPREDAAIAAFPTKYDMISV